MILFAALIALTALPQKSNVRVFPLRSIDAHQLFAALRQLPPTQEHDLVVRPQPLPTLQKTPSPGWVSMELRAVGVESLMPSQVGQSVVATGTLAGLLELQRRIEQFDKKLILTLRLVQDGKTVQQTTLSVRQYDQQSFSRPTGSPLTLSAQYRFQTRDIFLTVLFPNRTFRQAQAKLGTESKLVLPDGQELFVTAALESEARAR